MRVSRYWVHVLLFFLISICGLRAPAASKADSEAHPQSSAENAAIVLPLDYVSNHLYTTLNGPNDMPLTFLVDTGSERTAISSAIAKQSDLRKSLRKTSRSVTGYGNHPVDRQYKEVLLALRIAGTPVFSASALVFDFGEVSKLLGHPMDGVLGWDFFVQWCSTLDFGRKQLILRAVSNCEAPTGAQALKAKWSRRGLRMQSVITFQNGRSANALLGFDTGADNTILLNTHFRAIAGIGEDGPADSEMKGWGMNGEYTADVVPLASFKLDGDKIHVTSDAKTTILIGRKGTFSRTHWWLHIMGRVRDGGVGN